MLIIVESWQALGTKPIVVRAILASWVHSNRSSGASGRGFSTSLLACVVRHLFFLHTRSVLDNAHPRGFHCCHHSTSPSFIVSACLNRIGFAELTE